MITAAGKINLNFQLTICSRSVKITNASGGIAQLGERLNGIQEVSGSIPLISTKKHRNLCCGVFLSRRSSALILKTVQNSTQAPTEVCRGSACRKSPATAGLFCVYMIKWFWVMKDAGTRKNGSWCHRDCRYRKSGAERPSVAKNRWRIHVA